MWKAYWISELLRYYLCLYDDGGKKLSIIDQRDFVPVIEESWQSFVSI